MRVRRERPGDEVSVRAVVGEAFGDDVVPALLDAMRDSPRWVADLSLVAEDESGVVGHVAFTRGWLDAPDRLVDVLVLSPLAVRPDRQRAGIGGRLVRGALTLVERRPEPLVFLEGSPDYYSRLGFEPAAARGFVRPSVRIPEPAFQVLTTAAYEPWMRGALVYPEVFWAHDCVGLRTP